MTWYINDYPLSALQLQAKHDPDNDGGQHPGYLLWEWRFDVNRGKTIVGYWAWVKGHLDAEQSELDQSNPYNQAEGVE